MGAIMRFGRFLSSAMVLAVMGGAALASDMDLNGPTEVPPPSFKGRQYVDSAGCVFVRAGFGTSVSWVPRVTRDRKQLCGYKPTLAPGAPVIDVAKSAPAPAPTPAPTRAPAPAAAPAKPVVAAAPAPAKPAPAPAQTRPVSPFTPTPGVGAPMATIALKTTPPTIGKAAAPVEMAVAPPKPVVPAPAPAPVAAAAPAPGRYVSPYAISIAATPQATVAAPRPVVAPQPAPSPVAIAAATPVTIIGSETVTVPAACPNGAPVAQRYFLSDGRRVLRCGPERGDPVAFINRANLPGLQVAGLSGAVAAAPAPVYAAAPTAPAASAPAPSRAAYVSPYALPDSVYVNHAASNVAPLAPVQVSTKSLSGYRPAFDDGRLNPYRGARTAAGDAMQGQIWTDTVPAKLIPGAQPQALTQPLIPEARISSKSAPRIAPPAPVVKAAAPAIAATGFVQVGSFGQPGNAEGAKARLRALGLPVSTARAGKLTIVYAGPLTGAALPQALASARASGFADAFIR